VNRGVLMPQDFQVALRSGTFRLQVLDLLRLDAVVPDALALLALPRRERHVFGITAPGRRPNRVATFGNRSIHKA
jgi:hypothetical protein